MTWIHVVYIVLLASSFLIYPLAAPGEVSVFGEIAEVLALLIAAISLTFAQYSHASHDAPHKSWTWLAAGMWIIFFAELLFAHNSLISHSTADSSLADLFYVIAYVPLLVGLVLLVKGFRSTGLPMGSRRSHVLHALILLALYGTIFATLLWNLVTRPDPLVTRLLNVGYPTLDFLLVSVSSLLIRVSWTLRGGSLARSWFLLCAGFLLMGIADILYAYSPKPYLDVLFFSSYFWIGMAGQYQIRMLREV
jgi:hypothetical protein